MVQQKNNNTKPFQISFQKIAVLAVAVIAVPLFLSVLIFVIYTLHTNRQQILSERENTLDIYRSQFESTLEDTEEYLTDIATNDTDFQTFIYSNTKTDAYLAAEAVADKCKSLLHMHEMIGALCIYSETFDCYRLVYETSYPVTDLVSLRETICDTVKKEDNLQQWIPFSFSDRTVLLYYFTHHGTVFAAMVDPSRQPHSVPEDGSRIFYIQSDGTPYAPSASFGERTVPVPKNGRNAYLKDDDTRYNLVGLPLSGADGFLIYASPAVPLWEQMNTVQKLLLLVMLCLLLCIPGSWMLLHRILLIPVDHLSQTISAIEQGDQSIRVPQDSAIQEVTEISRTVNTMLDTIRRQKIDSYEQQLKTQHAQLQYLQLQIRPHFYLNCLNLIYSMAGEGKVHELQELTLDLSTYLRSIFKDSTEQVPLSSELRSVESYLRIQKAGAQFPPVLELMVDADVSEMPIPPLCILTFVENSVKHSTQEDAPLSIRIRCSLLSSEEGDYLNITILDNGGGVPSDQLATLNQTDDRLYTDQHVGIANIRHRLRLSYGDGATLSFRNASDGLCVDLFIPT